MPSCAVTTMLMTLVPSLRPIRPEALPETTLAPFTVIVAAASAAVGVTVMFEVVFITISV